jgi:hypothetical protein
MPTTVTVTVTQTGGATGPTDTSNTALPFLKNRRWERPMRSRVMRRLNKRGW